MAVECVAFTVVMHFVEIAKCQKIDILKRGMSMAINPPGSKRAYCICALFAISDDIFCALFAISIAHFNQEQSVISDHETRLVQVTVEVRCVLK